MVPLLDHKLYMRVFFRDGLEVVEEEGTGAGRARPFVAVLDNDFSTLQDESRMSVCLGRAKTRPEDWSGRCPCRHGRRGSVTENGAVTNA